MAFSIRSYTRRITLLGCASALGLSVFWGTASATAADEHMTTREVAAVDLKLSTSPDSALVLTGQVIEWNKPNHVVVSVNGQEHQIELTVTRATDSADASVKVGYWHNGEVLIPEQALVVPLQAERTVKAEQKAASLSLSVKPKQIPTRKKLEIQPGTDDPLAGL